MRIGAHDLSQRVLVIAEIGVNHDGSRDRAVELVRAAASAGADAVKFQVFTAERLMHPSARFAGYQQSRVDAADPIAMLRQYELADDALKQLAAEARRCGLVPIATPFSPEDLPRVVAMGCDAIKIASPDLVNRLLLTRACDAGLPLIVSTGAATAQEIDASLAWLTHRTGELVALHCVSSYPTPLDETNLTWIGVIARDGVVAGYSDHTDHLLAGAFAVVAGARVVEKHLTYDTHASGPDHSASFDPEQFADYVRHIRLAERMLGSGDRRVLDCEHDVRSVSRQSLVTLRALAKGEPIALSDLTTQRPADGIGASELDRVVGARVLCDLPAGTMLKPEMLDVA